MSHELTDSVFVEDSATAPDAPRPASSTPRQPVSSAPLVSLGVVLATFIALVTAGSVLAEGYHSNPWLLTWIPPTCCVTNDCCWEVSERELRPLDGDRWEVIATSQVVQRTGWTPDGKFYRCACDLAEGKWVKHQGANTRCVFVPLRSAGL